MNNCSLLITHAGVGSILTALKKDKKVIVAARLKQYKEHTNDHQLQILTKFDEHKYIIPLYDFDKLDDAIKQVKTFKPSKYKSNTKEFINLIESKISALSK